MHWVERQTKAALRDVEKIQSFLYPLNNSDPKVNLFQARARREDAVRMTVLQMSLAIEDLLDGLFWRFFAGYDPNSRKRVRKTAVISRQLDELLKSGRVGFDSKLRLARLIGIINKPQHNRLDTLKALRNKCAHHWMLNRIRTRGISNTPTKRLLEYEGKDLFRLNVLEDFMRVYSQIYLKLFGKYIS
jgi:hypothetical protein